MRDWAQMRGFEGVAAYLPPAANSRAGGDFPLIQKERLVRWIPGIKSGEGMIYGYIRVSTDKQNTENQRFEIESFCRAHSVRIRSWIEETISGTRAVEKRRLGRLLKRLGSGDVLICSELSRLGRNLFMIMEILAMCMKKGIQLWTIKDNYRLGTDISSKVLAFAFGLSAEIERNLISQRTREALARLRAEGRVLGRPRGALGRQLKLSAHEKSIRQMLRNQIPKARIARKYKVSRSTLYRFIRMKQLNE